MAWSDPVDLYCERLGPGFWAEPINASTNAAFLVAALIAWRRAGGDAFGRVLALLVGAIGIGGFLLHTVAMGWAATADVVPVLLFILTYLHAANRIFFGSRPWLAALGAAAFLPYAALAGSGFALLPFFEVAAAYWAVALLIGMYALVVPDPSAAWGLALGCAILTISIVLRTLDGPICDTIPGGTHFAWHLLNAVLLGWLADVRRRALARTGASG